MIKIRTLYEIIAEKDPSEIKLKELKAELEKYEAFGTPEELESWKTNGIKASKDLESYTQQLQEYIAKQSEQPEWLKVVIEKSKKYDEMQKGLAEAKKKLDNYKEPDYGPIETFDDAPDAGKTPPEDLKAKLAKYEAIGTPEELKKTLEQAKEGEDLKNRLDAAIKAIEEHKPTYQKKTPGEIKKMLGLN